MIAHTTDILRENETYFVADLNNGGVRIGMKNVVAFDFPASHKLYENVRGIELDDCEDAIDEMFVRHTPLQTDGYRNA